MSRRRALLSAIGESGGGGTVVDINNYLTMVSLANGFSASLSTNACEYCINGDGDWIALPAGTTTRAVTAGDTISFRANLSPSSSAGIGTFTTNASCQLTGNCMSLIFGDNAATALSLSGKNYAFYRLFKNCKNIVSVSSAFLPATTVSQYCYREMFYGCTALTATPSLPAKTIATYCYREMFRGCSKLTTASALPATTMQNDCYSYMFYGCTALKVAPDLPAKTAKQSCYNSMFYNCKALKTAPAIAMTTTATQCCRNMFYGCSSIEVAPDLLSESLTSLCYGNMFTNCSSLRYIRALFTTEPSSSYTANWLSGVASEGVFVKSENASWNVSGVNGIPNGWEILIG